MVRITVITLTLFVLAVGAHAQTAPSEFGVYQSDRRVPCISPAQRLALQKQIAINMERLKAEGKLPPASSATPPQFQWPLRTKEGFSDYGYYGISGFVDHDERYPGFLQDYFCGQRSYDLDIGYNHQGTDVFLWPFYWNKMDDDAVEIINASTGVIVLRVDGNYDRNCGLTIEDGNGVVIGHGDGSVVLYWHMKNGSVTDLEEGTLVFPGEYLGVVGSSGASSGPHLHLEVLDVNNEVIDPWEGSCNSTIDESWWVSQKPYFEPGINKVSTHFAPVQWGQCPDPDTLNISDTFELGDSVVFYVFGKDGLRNDVHTYTIYRPDGSVFDTWETLFSMTYAAAYVIGSVRSIPTSEPTGTWAYEVNFKGEAYVHEFVVRSQVPVFFHSLQVLPRDGAVELSWDIIADEQVEGFVVYRKSEEASHEIVLRDGQQLSGAARRFIDTDVQSGMSYIYAVSAITVDGSEFRSPPVKVKVDPLSIKLEQNHPNPFNPTTTIAFTLPDEALIELSIYDAEGRRIRTLERGFRSVGQHRITWDGRDARGNAVSTGVYFYRLKVGERLLAKKMIVLR